jgi:hypothetical protein
MLKHDSDRNKCINTNQRQFSNESIAHPSLLFQNIFSQKQKSCRRKVLNRKQPKAGHGLSLTVDLECYLHPRRSRFSLWADKKELNSGASFPARLFAVQIKIKLICFSFFTTLVSSSPKPSTSA